MPANYCARSVLHTDQLAPNTESNPKFPLSPDDKFPELNLEIWNLVAVAHFVSFVSFGLFQADSVMINLCHKKQSRPTTG